MLTLWTLRRRGKGTPLVGGRWCFAAQCVKGTPRKGGHWFSCQGKGTPTIGGQRFSGRGGKVLVEKVALMGGWEQWNDGSDERTVM